MASATADATAIDRDYVAPTVEWFFSNYDLVLVFYGTISGDGSGGYATLVTDDGSVSLPYGSDRPLNGERWRAIRTLRGDAWLDGYRSG